MTITMLNKGIFPGRKIWELGAGEWNLFLIDPNMLFTYNGDNTLTAYIHDCQVTMNLPKLEARSSGLGAS